MESMSNKGEILIKAEHAYACWGDMFEEDLLRLTPEKCGMQNEHDQGEIEIKTEIIEESEIKTEVAEEPEMKMELDRDIHNIPVAVSTNLEAFEVVPKSEFLELQKKYDFLLQNVASQNNSLIQDNKKLNLEMKKFQFVIKTTAFNQDVTIKQLENEISTLKSENGTLQTRQIDIFKNKFNSTENIVTDLRNKVQKFMTLHEADINKVVVIKSQLTEKENNSKRIEIKLNSTIRKLSKLRYRVSQLIKFEEKYRQLSKENEELFLKLRDFTEERVQNEMLTQKLERTLQRKEKVVNTLQSEHTNMIKNLQESESTAKLLKNKYKELFQETDQTEQALQKLREMVKNRDKARDDHKAVIVSLQQELQNAQQKSCEYCGL